MLACTCTNSFYERFRPPANLTHQPKFDFHPTTARTNSNPSRRPVRNKTVTLSEEKLSSCPEQTCHYPRFWPDFYCLKTITINKDKAPKYQYINGLSSEWDMSQDLQFDEQFFVGKDIILFDDIVTTGETMFAFYTKLRALGANILFCASLLYTPDLRCL